MKDVNGFEVEIGDAVVMNCLRNKGVVGVFTGFSNNGKEVGVISYSMPYVDFEGNRWADYIYASSDMFEVVRKKKGAKAG